MQHPLYEVLSTVHIPKMATIAQLFENHAITDYESVLNDQLLGSAYKNVFKEGMSIAITASSRGIHDQHKILHALVKILKEKRCKPFLIPAMGSHGGATAEGQLEILKKLNITEAEIGCPIVSSMETIEIGKTIEGLSVCIDKNAYNADGIIVFNRIKSHTAFRGDYESGLMKMMTIGLGKHHGAEICHKTGFKDMARLVPLFAHKILEKAPILFGIAVLENQHNKICHIEAILATDIPKREPALLKMSKKLMPKILFDNIDVLIIDEIGKNYSGDGQDPNISSRFATPYATGDFTINKVCVLDISKKSNGIMIGAGMADTCTQRLVDKARLEDSYINAITSTVFDCVRLPMILKNDWFAIAACIKCCNNPDLENVRMVRIKNTLDITTIQISETMVSDALLNSQISLLNEAEELVFDKEGNLTTRF